MAVLYISEFSNLPFMSNGVLQAADAQFWIDGRTVYIGVTSTPSTALNLNTNYVILRADEVCSIAWTMPGAGSVNAATTANLRLPANTPRLFGVVPGMKVSAISNT